MTKSQNPPSGQEAGFPPTKSGGYEEVVTIGPATVVLGDACDLLRQMKAGEVEQPDLIVTDAPYRVTSGGGGGIAAELRNRGGWMTDYANGGDIVTCDLEWADWMPLAYEAMKPDRQAYFMSNGRQLFDAYSAATNAGFDFHTLLVWDKRSALPNRYYQNITEFTLFMRKGKAFTIYEPATKNLFSLFQRDESEHPTEKPELLMDQYIRNSTKPQQLVCDPFLGSGTTGVAAVRRGRRFIGCEIERRWFDVSCERISRAVEAGPHIELFSSDDAAPSGESVSLFDDGAA